ncbi:hypothetical protein GCM10028796_01280 [Ramlibacter monticola]
MSTATELASLEALIQPVPPAVLDLVGRMRYPAAFSADSMRVGDSSAIGMLVLYVPDHVVLTVLDFAGRSELETLKIATADCRLYAQLVNEHTPRMAPIVPVRGFKDLLSELAGLRRLAARELEDTMAKLQDALRGPDAWSLLMLPPGQKLTSVTLTLCRPW